MRAAFGLWMRADWRRRRAATVALTLLVGTVCGVAMLFAAGARRTASSLDRFAAEARSADVVIGIGKDDPAAWQGVRDLRGVARTGSVTLLYAVVDGVEEDLGIIAPRDAGAGVQIDREVLLRGRRADPRRPDEVAINETAARITGLDVGDRVTILTLSPEQVAAEDYFPPRGPALDVGIVGVLRGLDDLQGTGGGFLATPALLPTIRGQVDEFETYIAVDLAEDTTAADFRAELATLPGGDALRTLTLAERLRSPRDTIDALSLGLTASAAVAALAGIVVVGQAVARHVAGANDDAFVLEALGMSRPDRRLAVIVAVLPTALAGAGLAALVTVAASPLLPVGLARRADPVRGIAVDWLVVPLGAATVIAVATFMAAVRPGWFAASDRRRKANVSGALAATRGVLAQPPSLVGTSLAAGHGVPVLPVRAALTGLVVGVAGCIGVIVFSSTLDRLVASPDRWGYGWDVLMNFTSDSVDDATKVIATDERFDGVGRLDVGIAGVGGEQIRAFGLSPVSGEIGFVLRSGRQPVGAGEAVLGPSTADDLRVGIGDEVQVHREAGETDGGEVAVEVVGIGLFPEVDERPYDTGIGFDDAGFAASAGIAEQFNANQLVVRLADGVDVDRVLAELAEEHPESVSPVESLPFAPAPVRDLASIRSMPTWLGILVSTLALSSLVHVLVTTVRRRRRELATLRALGFTSRDTARTIVVESLTLTALAALIGVPAGVAAGTVSWRVVADPINVASDVVRPLGLLGLALLVIGVLGLLAAAAPAWRAARLDVAAALRAE